MIDKNKEYLCPNCDIVFSGLELVLFIPNTGKADSKGCPNCQQGFPNENWLEVNPLGLIMMGKPAEA